MPRSRSPRPLTDRQLVRRIRCYETVSYYLATLTVLVFLTMIAWRSYGLQAGAVTALPALACAWCREQAKDLLEVARRRGVARGITAALEAEAPS